MISSEVANRFIELGIVWQLKTRHKTPDLFDMLGQQMPGQEKFGDVGFNAEEKEEDSSIEDEAAKREREKNWMDTITEPSELERYSTWFLGANPPELFKGRIIGQVMTATIKDRNLTIKLEEVPWGLQAGIVSFNCEYITGIDYKSGTLFIASKVGNVAIQIHEVTEDQCKDQISWPKYPGS